MDAFNAPHIAYSQSNQYTTRYAWIDNGTWQIYQLPGSGAYGINLFLDEDGNPHISDSQSGTGLRYSFFDGTAWTHETGIAPASQYNSLTFDNTGRPHVSYYLADGGNYDLFISIKNNKSWPTYLVDHGLQQSKRGWDNHLTPDANSTIHIVYFAHNEQQIKHAFGNDDQWEVEVVDNVGMWDSGIEVFMDGNNLYTSYYDDDLQLIRLAAIAGDFAPPENLVAEVVNENDVQLEFEHISKYSLVMPSHFNVYMNDELIDQISGDIYEYLVPDLQPGNYQFYITALFGDQHESDSSNFVSIGIFDIVAMPTFNPEPGIYVDSVMVEILSDTPDVTLHFTLDGTEPTENSPLYEAPILIDTTAILKARGYKENWLPSEISSGAYIIDYSIGIYPFAVQNAGLLKASPNPFSGQTTITILLSERTDASLEIFDLHGTKINTLFKGSFGVGEHTVLWNGFSSEGKRLPQGVYFCRFVAGKNVDEIKLLMVR